MTVSKSVAETIRTLPSRLYLSCLFLSLILFSFISKSKEISDAAVKIAKEVAAEHDRHIMIAGSLAETTIYQGPESRKRVEEELQPQIETFMENDVDFVIAEVRDIFS